MVRILKAYAAMTKLLYYSADLIESVKYYMESRQLHMIKSLEI